MLRDEIAMKRAVLTQEIQELKRRRAEAVIQAKQYAQLAGIAAIGILAVGSIVGAVVDMFRDNEKDEASELPDTSETTIAKNSFGDALVIVAKDTLQAVAVNFVRKKIMEYASRFEARQSGTSV